MIAKLAVFDEGFSVDRSVAFNIKSIVPNFFVSRGILKICPLLLVPKVCSVDFSISPIFPDDTIFSILEIPLSSSTEPSKYQPSPEIQVSASYSFRFNSVPVLSYCTNVNFSLSPNKGTSLSMLKITISDIVVLVDLLTAYARIAMSPLSFLSLLIVRLQAVLLVESTSIP